MTTQPETDYVRRQIEGRFFAEALYFGALALARTPSAELHLYIGLACCGAAGGTADVQRILHGDPDAPSGGGRPMAGNATRLVYEGFYHLLEAARRGARLPDELAPVAAEILADLGWYLREDFKGYASGGKHTLGRVGAGAAVLLRRLVPDAPRGPAAVRIDGAEELVDDELARHDGDATFYGALRPMATAP